ncbi:hypothetical protein BVY01_04670 [bacterium I07]|nr:hypothetical protein BVY01_04670 [bacterium I07]
MELFEFNFFQNALLMGLLLAGLFGMLSFFVVLRKMAFLGAGIAHTAFGGVAIGVVLGINPFFTALGFCLLSALIVSKIVRLGHVSFDTGIGIFFSFSMALGALLISLRKAYTFDLSGYLFGNILGITTFDLIMVTAAACLFGLFIWFSFHKLLFMSFEENMARVSGVNADLLDTILLSFLALIIVISIKVVGIILVSALVVLPASFGQLWTMDYRKVILVSLIYAVFILLGGLILSYFLDTPPGATIVVLGTTVYFLVLAGKNSLIKTGLS